MFNGQTLAEVIAEVSRYTTVTIELASPELAQLTVGGQIEVADPEAMFHALEANFGVLVQRSLTTGCRFWSDRSRFVMSSRNSIQNGSSEKTSAEKLRF